MDEPYLLMDLLIHLREIAVIYSKAGMGKTFLASFIAKTAHPKKRRILRLTIKEATNWNVFKDQAQIQYRKEKLMKELGVYEQEKVDKLFIFELLVESSLCNDSEILVLDSLNALLDYESKISRPYIDRITRYCRESGKTLLILHHSNKKKEIAGHSSLSQAVDLVLKLDGDPGNLLEVTAEKSRYLQGCKSCYLEMISEGNNSVRFEYRGENDQEPKNGLSPLENEIIIALGDNETLPSEKLFSCLGGHHKNSILNSLKRLEEKGMVSKLDGRTWETIKKLVLGGSTA